MEQLKVLRTSTYYGRRPNGFYVPRYRNIGNDKRDYLRGFGYEGGSGRGWNMPNEDFGVDFKNNASKPGPWNISLSAFAETLPYFENKMWIDETKKINGACLWPTFLLKLVTTKNV